MKMIPEIKAAWFEALRSGKFAQSTGALSGSAGYCCLGVLCVVLKEKFPESSTAKNIELDYERIYCDGVKTSMRAQNWTNLFLPMDDNIRLYDAREVLIQMNDKGTVNETLCKENDLPIPKIAYPRHDFTEIANYIEANF